MLDGSSRTVGLMSRRHKGFGRYESLSESPAGALFYPLGRYKSPDKMLSRGVPV
jgi:hypothetical protein